jgi:uncharacterized protein YcfL
MRNLLLIAGLVVGLQGCMSTNAVVTQTSSNGQTNVRVISGNPTLSAQVAISRVSFQPVGSLKRVSLQILNRMPLASSFQYKVNWLDSSGTEINPENSIWKPITLSGGEAKGVQSLAPDERGSDILVYIKP